MYRCIMNLIFFNVLLANVRQKYKKTWVWCTQLSLKFNVFVFGVYIYDSFRNIFTFICRECHRTQGVSTSDIVGRFVSRRDVLNKMILYLICLLKGRTLDKKGTVSACMNLVAELPQRAFNVVCLQYKVSMCCVSVVSLK